jgi:general secretion pathway protein G
MPAERDDTRVFFPWEKRPGLRSLFMRARARQILLVVCAVPTLGWMWGRERRASEVRATRATIATAVAGLAAWRADHDHSCPASLVDLVASGYLRHVPRDAWGRPLRLTCPGRIDRAGFDVSSDGPDGEPGGLDRVQ